jgi:RNA polymerase sigma factor (sigma-70 family)
MARTDPRMNQGRLPSPRLDELDSETVHSVRDYLAARSEGCVPDSRLIEAWDRFYAAYDPLIRRLARPRASSIEDLDDRVQDIWKRIVVHFLQYDPNRGPFQNWLTIVIRHVLAAQGRSHHPLGYLDPESEQRLPSREADPSIGYELIEERLRILTAITELRLAISEKNYRIMYDHWIEGKSFAEISLTVGLSRKQVRDRHHRMMGRIRERLLHPG